MLTNDGPNSIQELESPSHSGINEIRSARTVHGGFVGVQESALESAIVNLEARKAHGPSERIGAPVFVDKFLELKELCVGAARVVLEPAAIIAQNKRLKLPLGPTSGPCPVAPAPLVLPKVLEGQVLACSEATHLLFA